MNASRASAGVTGSARRISGMAPSPPGTEPPPDEGGAAPPVPSDGEEGGGDGAGEADAAGDAGAPIAIGSTGCASGTSSGGRVAPPGVAVNDADRMSGAD